MLRFEHQHRFNFESDREYLLFVDARVVVETLAFDFEQPHPSLYTHQIADKQIAAPDALRAIYVRPSDAELKV